MRPQHSARVRPHLLTPRHEPAVWGGLRESGGGPLTSATIRDRREPSGGVCERWLPSLAPPRGKGWSHGAITPYVCHVITAVLGAPGSGKSAAAEPLAELLPAYIVLDWDAFMAPAGALTGREIRQSPSTWPAYRQLVRAVLEPVRHLPVVLLGVCTPAELSGWPIDAWAVLDCTDQERQRRLAHHGRPESAADAVADAARYRSQGLPIIDTTGLTPARVANELANFVRLQAGSRLRSGRTPPSAGP